MGHYARRALTADFPPRAWTLTEIRRAETTAQSCRYRPQYPIASLMAVLVIDGLEAIEVEVQ
jgi:hypothetical protein